MILLAFLALLNFFDMAYLWGMTFRFNIRKATEAASLFIKMEGGKLNVMKLVKLVYLLDRTSIARRGFVSGGRAAVGQLSECRAGIGIAESKGANVLAPPYAIRQLERLIRFPVVV